LNEKVKPLKLDGVSPANENVIEGIYLLARPVFFLTKGEPSGLVKEFIDFVMSKEGQDLIKEKGLIPARAY
jgi:phosphate transport system substrate-binding protein